jgi:glycopeptide antibiotics resistance protein
MVQYIRIYGGLAVLLALIALVAATIAVVAAVIAARRGWRFSTTTVRGVAWVLAVTCAAAVYVLTLFPMAARGSVVNLVPFSTFAALTDPTATTLVQLVGNVLLLSWIGILMPALARRPWPSWQRSQA